MDSFDPSAAGQHDRHATRLDHVAEVCDRDVQAASAAVAPHAQTSHGDAPDDLPRHADTDAHAESHPDAHAADPARARREQQERVMVAGPRASRNARRDLEHRFPTGGDRQLGGSEGQPRPRASSSASNDGGPSPQVESEGSTTHPHLRAGRTEVGQRDRRPTRAAQRDPRRRGRERRERSLSARPIRGAGGSERENGDRCARRENHRPITVNVTVAV
jgi:hypothetical protein